MPQTRSKSRADALLVDAIAKQNRARQTLNFNVLGKLYLLETERGSIRFEQQKGPGIAQTLDATGAPDGGLAFASEWKTLPMVHDYSEEFCQACLATCDVCNGKSISACIHVGCGGAGKVQRGEDPCPKCTVRKAGGLAKAYCETCGGSRAVPHFENCPSCDGSGQAPCGACRGTGKRPTGRNEANDAMCSACKGTQRAGGWKTQRLEEIISGKIGSEWLVIGPVLRLVISPPGGESNRATFLRVTPGVDADGRRLLILLPQVQNPADFRQKPIVPYFFGGVVA